MILGFGGVQCFRALGWEQVFSLLFVHHFPCSNSSSFILVFPSSFIFCSSSSWVLKFRHLHEVQNSQMVSCLFSSCSWCLFSLCCFWQFYSLCYFCCLFFELTFFLWACLFYWFVGWRKLHHYGHLLCVHNLAVIILLLVVHFNGFLFFFGWVFFLLFLAFIFSLLLLPLVLSLLFSIFIFSMLL